jgi:hypothetical protein
MSVQMTIAERLKVDLLDELHLMKSADMQEYWQQAKWPKPNLVELNNGAFVGLPRNMVKSNKQRRIFAPLRYALGRLQPEDVAMASDQLDPFGSLLAAVDVTEWIQFCGTHHEPWLTRVWLAAASQLRAELRLIFRAHGWSDTWENLRRNPNDRRAAENFLVAQLSHARKHRNELLKIRIIGLSETSRRRLRRTRSNQGKRAGVAAAEKFIVQHWLELPLGFPGLCFFSDPALNDLLDAFGLKSGADTTSKQMRVRLGLTQAGAKQHLIEQVLDLTSELRLTGSQVKEPWVIKGKLSWGKRRLWLSSG